jgi:hypothetical protein
MGLGDGGTVTAGSGPNPVPSEIVQAIDRRSGGAPVRRQESALPSPLWSTQARSSGYEHER